MTRQNPEAVRPFLLFSLSSSLLPTQKKAPQAKDKAKLGKSQKKLRSININGFAVFAILLLKVLFSALFTDSQPRLRQAIAVRDGLSIAAIERQDINV